MKKKPKCFDGLPVYPLGSTVRYVFEVTKKGCPRLLWWCAASVAVQVLLPVLTMYLPSTVIAGLTAHAGLGRLALIVLLFTVPMALLSAAKEGISTQVRIGKSTMGTYYLRLVALKGLRTDYPNLEKESFRKLQLSCYQACDAGGSAVRIVYECFITIAANALGFLVYFAVLSRMNLLVVGLIAVSALADFFLDRTAWKWDSAHRSELAGYTQKLGYIDTKVGDVRNAKDIRLYGMYGWLSALYNRELSRLRGWYRRKHDSVFRKDLAKGVLAMLREGGAYAYLLVRVFHGGLSAAEFVLYFAAITGFSGWLLNLLGQLDLLQQCNIALSQLRGYFDYPDAFPRGGRTADGLTGAPATLELRHVSYRYAGSDKDTLHDLCLTFAPGEHLAIVGLNGAGKTTLVKLLCGLLDPTEGQVLYGGVDVREFDRAEYYRLFSTVFQDFSLLPVTAQEIVAEEPTEALDAARVETCLRQAGLWDDIAALPKGVRQPVGKTVYDDGAEFSGGQVQKLVLARALYKDAPVMLLDEPTAALDPIAESRMYTLYATLMKQKTAVFISHRLASTRFCSRILLLEDGVVREEGSHEALLAQKGRYYTLFETQAKYYREKTEEPDVSEPAEKGKAGVFA